MGSQSWDLRGDFWGQPRLERPVWVGMSLQQVAFE